jgi:hypothetical protein
MLKSGWEKSQEKKAPIEGGFSGEIQPNTGQSPASEITIYSHHRHQTHHHHHHHHHQDPSPDSWKRLELPCQEMPFLPYM